MGEKIIVLMIVSLGMLFNDVKKLKKSNRRERVVYGVLMIPIVYLSLIYVMDLAWPNLDELFHFFFSKPAHQIVEALKVPM